MPGKPLGLDGNLVAIYLVLTFGWIGSPGEYMAFGNALKQYHDRHAPEAPDWHDEVPFHSHLLMGDDVLIEPLLGRRPWMAARLAEEGAARLAEAHHAAVVLDDGRGGGERRVEDALRVRGGEAGQRADECGPQRLAGIRARRGRALQRRRCRRRGASSWVRAWGDGGTRYKEQGVGCSG
mgnify:CR=1 FL=1